MSSYGVFEVDLFIKGKIFTHPVNVIEELNENIIGIDFIHAHKLTYDVISRKVMFAGAGTNSIIELKNTVLPVNSDKSQVQRHQRGKSNLRG